MAVDPALKEQIEALTRSEFRAIVNPERRATLAIGALMLSWGQFDSALGHMIKEMKAHLTNLGLDALSDEHPPDQPGQLKLLRKLIVKKGVTDTSQLADVNFVLICTHLNHLFLSCAARPSATTNALAGCMIWDALTLWVELNRVQATAIDQDRIPPQSSGCSLAKPAMVALSRTCVFQALPLPQAAAER